MAAVKLAWFNLYPYMHMRREEDEGWVLREKKINKKYHAVLLSFRICSIPNLLFANIGKASISHDIKRRGEKG
jgi:hypothetical protein